MKNAVTLCSCLALTAAASAQQSVSLDLTNVRIQNGNPQSRTSAPNTISPALRYHVVVDGMVKGNGGVLGSMFPNPTPLAQEMETLSPGSSANLSGDYDNCTGTHPISLQGQTISGSQVILGITVNYAMTLSTGIDAVNVAYFNLTNVVLTPSFLVGYLSFTSGAATVTRIEFCPANCDN